MKRAETVVNRHRQPITLDSGVILAAAGTEGHRREKVLISEADERRHVNSGRIVLLGEVTIVDASTSTDETTSAGLITEPKGDVKPESGSQKKGEKQS